MINAVTSDAEPCLMLQTVLQACRCPHQPALERISLRDPALTALVMAEIDAACAGPDGRAWADRASPHALERCRSAAGLPDARIRVPRSDGCYARHIVRSDPAGRFTLRVDRLEPGPVQPAACASHLVRLCGGTRTRCTETLFEFDPAAQCRAAAGCVRPFASPAMPASPMPGLNKSTGLVMPGQFPRSRIHAYGVERAQSARM